jgi:crotonobetainyl-CoA:carnitine CoA-transferase CaiB-like acyl-CoA transferase
MRKILDGVRVLDFTHVWFGPYCTMMLGDIGAEVILVEPPWGNIGRLGPGELYKGTSTSFMALNQGKKGIAIDMKQPEGIALVKELAKESDIMVQNYVPGVMERLGLGYEDIKKIKPDIVYAALSGFGQTGPYRGYASYAVIAEALSGHSYANGNPTEPNGVPKSLAGAIGDLAPGTMAAFAIMAAFYHKTKTGEGQFIDVNQVDTMVSYNAPSTTDFSLFGESSAVRRARKMQDTDPDKPTGPAQIWGMIKVKDGWIQVAGSRPKAMEELKKYLGVEDVDAKAIETFKAKLSEMTKQEAFDFLVKFGFPAAPVYQAHEAMDDPHVIAREMFIEVEHPIAGKYKTPNFPVKFSATPGKVTSAVPVLGQHTEEVLKSILKKTPEQIAALENSGTIMCWRP